MTFDLGGYVDVNIQAENEFKQVLGVPKQVTVYAFVPVGWPAGRFGPVRRRPVADVVHWGRWSR